MHFGSLYVLNKTQNVFTASETTFKYQFCCSFRCMGMPTFTQGGITEKIHRNHDRINYRPSSRQETSECRIGSTLLMQKDLPTLEGPRCVLKLDSRSIGKLASKAIPRSQPSQSMLGWKATQSTGMASGFYSALATPWSW